MMRRVLLSLGLLFVSLMGEAKLVVPDSLLTITKAYVYNITSPDTALAILQTIRERNMATQSQIDFAEGDVYFNLRQFRKALPYYKRVDADKTVDDSTKVQLLLLKRIMDCYDALYDEDDLIHSIIRLRDKARECKDKAFESMTYFMSGKWHHYNGLKDKGYSSCLDAVEMMRATDYPSKHTELRNYYGELLKMYARDGRYDDALRLSKLQETEALYPSSSIILKARDRGLRQVYALRASMLANAGRMAEAEDAYMAWTESTGGNAIDDMEIFDYLRVSRKNEKALAIVTSYRDFISAQGDTMSYRMLSILNKEGLLHIDMGAYQEAALCGKKLGVIADSIHKRRGSEQMKTTYDLLQEQSASHRMTMWIFLLVAALVLATLVGLVILYYVRAIRRRNMIFLRLFNRLDAYRQAVINGNAPTSPEVLEALNEVISLEEEVSADSSEQTEEPDDEDRRLFVEMDTQVTRDRIFLKPGLGREDLMRLIGVDKNRFGKMMSKYSDATNTSVYINAKRVEYGAMLLLEHPEYTVASVAAECGMSTPVTFNRIFKETYNMTPSEYREKMGAVLQAGSHQKA